MLKIKGFIFIILIYTAFFVLCSCSNNKIQIFSDKRFNFSVEFPKNWNSEIETTWDATPTQEASPDGGVDIYVEGVKDDKIEVYGQNGHIGILPLPNFKKTEFVTNSGLKGMLYSQTTENRKEIYLLFDEGFHAVHINVSSDCFKSNEKKIMDILKSINIISVLK